MKCKVCGRKSEDYLCLRCEKIREDAIYDLLSESGRYEDALCVAGEDK